jgi:hypothetical protein
MGMSFTRKDFLKTLCPSGDCMGCLTAWRGQSGAGISSAEDQSKPLSDI